LINRVKFAFLISITAILVMLVLIFFKVISVSLGSSFLVATAISLINFSLFMFLFSYSYKKTNKIFLLFTVGGMGVRLFLMLIAVFLSIKFLNVDVVGFIFAFFISYVFLLIYEISIVRFGLEKK